MYFSMLHNCDLRLAESLVPLRKNRTQVFCEIKNIYGYISLWKHLLRNVMRVLEKRGKGNGRIFWRSIKAGLCI